MFGVIYDEPGCIGPLVFFKDKSQIRYAFGKKSTREIIFDDGETTRPGLGAGGVQTHGPIIDAINTRFDLDIPRGVDPSSLHCRVWGIKGKVYIGSWNDIDQIKSFGHSEMITKFKEAAKQMTGVSNSSRILINPWNEETMDSDPDLSYTLDQFQEMLTGGKKKEKITTSQKQELAKQLHLLPPAEKAKLLQKMGAQGKVGNVPDFKKRAALGIDERK